MEAAKIKLKVKHHYTFSICSPKEVNLALQTNISLECWLCWEAKEYYDRKFLILVNFQKMNRKLYQNSESCLFWFSSNFDELLPIMFVTSTQNFMVQLDSLGFKTRHMPLPNVLVKSTIWEWRSRWGMFALTFWPPAVSGTTTRSKLRDALAPSLHAQCHSAQVQSRDVIKRTWPCHSSHSAPKMVHDRNVGYRLVLLRTTSHFR